MFKLVGLVGERVTSKAIPSELKENVLTMVVCNQLDAFNRQNGERFSFECLASRTLLISPAPGDAVVDSMMPRIPAPSPMPILPMASLLCLTIRIRCLQRRLPQVLPSNLLQVLLHFLHSRLSRRLSLRLP